MLSDDDDVEVFGQDGMRMVRLPLSAVVLREGWSARDAPTEDEIARAAVRFSEQPMLHAPVVAKRGEEWTLVAGFIRFHAWRRLEQEHGVFRWIDGTETELLLLSLAENVARARLRPHELVSRIAALRGRGISAKEIAKYCDYSPRYVRQLAAMRRDAHPELWALFTQQTPHLGVSAMLDLVAHPQEEQLERWLEAEKHWRRGDTWARGFAEDDDEAHELAAGATPRRRFPKRRVVKRLLKAVLAEESIGEDYRQGIVDALQWMLFDQDLGTRFSWKTLRSLERQGAKVIPIRPGLEPGGAAPSQESQEPEGVVEQAQDGSDK